MAVETALGADKKIAIVGCKHTTKDLILGLRRHGIRLAHCVTITPEKGTEQKVAGYYDLRPFLHEIGLPYTIAQKYSLKSEQDHETLLALGLDMLLVMGWQRLIQSILCGCRERSRKSNGSTRTLISMPI